MFERLVPSDSVFRRWLKRLLASALSAGLGLILLEGAVRLLWPDLPTSETGIVPHPIWHHWHRENYRFTYQVPGEGIRQQVCFNERGMRDSSPRSIEKPPGIRRVAVLGDSFVEALQVEEHEGICRQLETLLGSSTQTEVLNFGCSGFSTSLEYLIFREWVRHWKPDVVLCLHHFSDITEDWRFRSRAVGMNEDLQAIVPSGTGWGRRVRRVLDLSSAWRLLHRSLRSSRAASPASLKEGYDAIVHEPYNEEDEEALAYSLNYARLLDQELRHEGVPFLLVLIPLGPQVEPVPPDLARQVGLRYLADGRLLEHTGYQRAVTAFCQQHGIAVLDLVDGFRSANPSGVPLLYLPHDQHWTAEGHAVAARLVASWLEQGSLGRARVSTDLPPLRD
jgi:hypothetical protein